LVALRSRCLLRSAYRDKKVVGVFVRFFVAPLHPLKCLLQHMVRRMSIMQASIKFEATMESLDPRGCAESFLIVRTR
jgi:hypothetical protein